PVLRAGARGDQRVHRDLCVGQIVADAGGSCWVAPSRVGAGLDSGGVAARFGIDACAARVAAQPVPLALVVAVEPRLFGLGFDHRGPGHHQTFGHLVCLGCGEVVGLGRVTAAAARSSLVAVVAVVVVCTHLLRPFLWYVDDDASGVYRLTGRCGIGGVRGRALIWFGLEAA